MSGESKEPPSLATALVKLGHNQDAFKHSGHGEGPTLLERGLRGEIITTMPAVAKVPNGLELFVFPRGFKLTRMKRDAAFHSFVLTMLDGKRSYCYCATIYLPLAPEKLSIVKMQIAAQLMMAEDPDICDMPEKLYAPWSLCVISVNPFHDSFNTMLQRFVQDLDANLHELPDGCVEELHAALMTPLAPPGHGLQLQFKDTSIPFQVSVFDEMPRVSDSIFEVLFSSVEPKNIITLVNAMLSEVSVVVFSASASKLTPTLEALMALLYPMKWPYIYIPLLPSSLGDIFDAIQPYVIGTLSETLHSPPWPENALLLDLDNNVLTNFQPFEPLPWRLSWRLFDGVMRHYNAFQILHPDAEVTPPSSLPANAKVDKEAVEESVTMAVLTLRTTDAMFSGSDTESSANEEEPSTTLTPSTTPSLRQLHLKNSNTSISSETSGEPWQQREREISVLSEDEGDHTPNSASESASEDFAEHKVELSYSPVPDVDSEEQEQPIIEREIHSGDDAQLGSSDAPMIIPKKMYGTLKNFFQKLPFVSEDEETTEECTLPVEFVRNVRATRKKFLSLFVSILKGYRLYLNSPDTEMLSETTLKDMDIDANALFDKLGFETELANDYKDFVKRFMDSQMFTTFIEDRFQMSQPDWFDIRVLRRRKKQITQQRLNRRTRFSGYMWKRGRNFPYNYKRRWFELDGMDLSYYQPSKRLTDLKRQTKEAQRIALERNTPEAKAVAKKLRAMFEKVKKAALKGRVHLVEGQTLLTIPMQVQKYHTRYAFVINIYQTRKKDNLKRKLICCTDDAESRREWMKMLRARIFRERAEFLRLPSDKSFHDKLNTLRHKRLQTSSHDIHLQIQHQRSLPKQSLISIEEDEI